MTDFNLKRQITNLKNYSNDIQEPASKYLKKSEPELFQLRREIEVSIQSNKPLFGCEKCGQAVALRSRKSVGSEHSFYFKHLYNSGDCPDKLNNNFTKEEVRCMQYNGAKESDAHIELKSYIARYLEQDDRFDDIQVEKVIKGSGWSRRWKKPDICALFKGRRVVFEIQLSTTFLDVIVSREEFYRSEGIPIFWIFANFDPKESRATEKDIFFNNNNSALSVDTISRDNSIASQQLIFNGHYQKAVFSSNKNDVLAEWHTMPVGFDQITFDPKSHKPSFYDFDQQAEMLMATERSSQLSNAIKELEEIATQRYPDYSSRRYCADLLNSLGLYDQADMDSSFLNLVKSLMSVRDATVYFENQRDKWAWLANYIWSHHIHYWLVFVWAVETYKMYDTVFSGNEKLQRKHAEFKNTWSIDPKFKQSNRYFPLLVALLPDLSNALQRLEIKIDSINSRLD